jgi:hypothetical protein
MGGMPPHDPRSLEVVDRIVVGFLVVGLALAAWFVWWTCSG